MSALRLLELPVMFKLRCSTESDTDRVLEIWRSAVDATHDFLAPLDRVAIDAEVSAFLPQVSLILAVDASDTPQGFMLLGGGHMEALFVDPDQFGRGIGKALVEAALADHPRLTTDVNEQNPQALGFYEHMGFEIVGRSTHDGQGRAYPLIHLRYAR
ncbi:acetyltransferase [Aeoliella sp. SH292]|uniref:acetyltransferase n=1 Tax=Aeoliella sp. SH292 TaxID=3454464 RepID=UPI003F957DD0